MAVQLSTIGGNVDAKKSHKVVCVHFINVKPWLSFGVGHLLFACIQWLLFRIIHHLEGLIVYSSAMLVSTMNLLSLQKMCLTKKAHFKPHSNPHKFYYNSSSPLLYIYIKLFFILGANSVSRHVLLVEEQ